MVNFGLFSLLTYLGVDYKIANFIAIILTKVYAFIPNKLFVFKSRCKNLKELAAEFARFFTGRIFTGVIDYFGVILLVEVFLLSENVSKIALQVVVIILNYVFAKFSFKNRSKDF